MTCVVGADVDDDVGNGGVDDEAAEGVVNIVLEVINGVLGLLVVGAVVV